MTLHLYLLQPAIVFQARVNQTAFPAAIDSCTFDTVTTGAYGDIVGGMTVLFGSAAAADDYGRQRIRKAATADTLYFGRSSKGTNDGEVSLADDAYITVLDDYRVWAKIPYIDEDGNIYKDSDLKVGDKTTLIPPKANGGTGMAGTVDATSGVLTVDFTSAGSYALSGTISNYLWDVDDGTITVGTASSSTITATFPPGFRWVSLTVVDSNFNTHTTRIPVYARNAAADTTIQAFTVESHIIRKEGQQLSVRVLSDIPMGTYLDGTLVMMWEDEPKDGSDRSHMRFVGWHHADPATIRAKSTGTMKDTVLECLDVAGRLDILPGFPISVEGKSPPASWLEMTSPNMDKYLDYIFRWHSTALEVAMLTLSGTGSSYPFVILGSDAQSIWDQAARRCQSLVPDYVLVCNTKGAIAIKPDPMIQEVADRTAAVQISLTEDDWLDISYTHQRQPRVHWLRSEAVLASATQLAALFSVAPDTTPGQGESEQTNGEQLAISQDDLNAAEGNRYARLNTRETNFAIAITHTISRNIEPADMTWVQMNITAATAAQRGLTFTNENGLVHEMNIRYQHGRTGLVRDVTINWERETNGPPATTYTPPDTDFTPPFDPDLGDGFDPYVPPPLGNGFGTCYVMTASALVRTRNLSLSSPVWVDISGAAAGDTMYDFILDPWNPASAGYLLTDAGLYKSVDLDTESPTFSIVCSYASILTATAASNASPRKVIASINVEDYVAFATGTQRTSTGYYNVYCFYSANGGSTWASSQIGSDMPSDLGWNGAFDYVPHLVGGNVRLYCAFGRLNVRQAYRSDNGGATWSLILGPGTLGLGGDDPNGASAIHCPYNGNEDGNIAYFGWETRNGDGILKTIDGGSTTTKLTLPYDYDGLSFRRTGIETHTLNNQLVYAICYSGAATVFCYSTNGGSSWSTVFSFSKSSMTYASGGFPTVDTQFYRYAKNGVFVSIDGGATWINKTGNFASVAAVDDPAPTLSGVIVPLWLAE